ncbi:MAG: S1C family serine protease [Acidimicrobiales bacterium]
MEELSEAGRDVVVDDTGRGSWTWGPSPDEADDERSGADDTAPLGTPKDGPPTTTIPPVRPPPAAPVTPALRPAGPAPAPPPTGGGNSAGWVAVAVVAALIGAVVGGGVAALVADDDGGGNGSSVTASRSTSTVAPFGNNSSRLAQPQDIQGVLAKVQPGVVAIRTGAFQGGRGFDLGQSPVQGAGTGVILDTDGNILTNAHVVRGAQTIQVTLFGEREPRQAVMVGSDEAADLAVIRVNDTSGLENRAVELGRSADLKVGDDVVAIGNALALPGGPTVTTGIVSALERSIDQLSDLIQTDAAINPGNSGGPLVNSDGQVIGINTAVAADRAQGIGFAIAIDTVKPLLDRLIAGEAAPAQGFLGVSTVTLTPEIRAQFGYDAEAGAIVVEVVPGSPAAIAGLEADDVITRIGDQAIEDNANVQTAVRAHKPDAKVEIEWSHGADTRTATVTLGTRPTS